jgi:hypothetical protein
MSLALDDIPRVAGSGEKSASRLLEFPSSELSRRGFLWRAGIVGAVIGLKTLGVFPPARQALADGYDIWTSLTTGPCGPGGYAQGHNCSPGCGPSTVCGGGSYGPCCDGSWFSTNYPYALRPNQCYTGGYDGWKWRCSSTLVYRCHDGWYVGPKGPIAKLICRANFSS